MNQAHPNKSGFLTMREKAASLRTGTVAHDDFHRNPSHPLKRLAEALVDIERTYQRRHGVTVAGATVPVADSCPAYGPDFLSLCESARCLGSWDLGPTDQGTINGVLEDLINRNSPDSDAS